MTVILLAHNGIGLGHLSRSLALADALRTLGLAPEIWTQGGAQRWLTGGYATTGLPVLYRVRDAARGRIAIRIAERALASRPSVLIEDTHPAWLDMPAGVRRVLIVRPTTFSYLRHLRRYDCRFHALLVADAPDSPTWPYTDRQTADLLRWDRWHVAGPIYRTPSHQEVVLARQRWSRRHDQRLFLMSFGGGGLHSPGDPDLSQFVERCRVLRDTISSRCHEARFLFVRGPLMRRRLTLGRMRQIRIARMLPALLAVVDGALIRSGFNTTWECLAVGTPFEPFVGRFHEEPIHRRLDRLRRMGLICPSRRWLDERVTSAFANVAYDVTSRWPGSVSANVLLEHVIDPPDTSVVHRLFRFASDPASRRW